MRTVGLVLVCLGFGFVAAAADDELFGTWIVMEEVRSVEREFRLTITEGGGVWAGEGRSTDLSDFQVENGTVTFTRAVNRLGQQLAVEYRASVVDGVLVGTMASARGESEFTAALMPESERLAIEYRAASIADLGRCDILAVFAHPDDETFASGTFAKLSANGVEIQLVYATSGDAGGDRTGQGLSGADLARAREQEMNDAADVLNVSTEPLFLRYPDGFVRDNWDDVLSNVESIIEKTQPEIVVTFGPDGYYGHRDHLAIGQIAERAFDELGIASYLLHVAIPRSINDRIKQAGGGDRYKAVDDKYITYMVNVKKQTNQRVGAMEAHRTQFDDRTVNQMRMLGALTGKEGFVEVRNLGEAGTLAGLFSRGDDDRRGN